MRQFVIRQESQYLAMCAYVRNNWKAMADQEKPLVVTVSEYKDKRHNQQNRLMWALLRQISDQAMISGQRYTDDCWHEELKGRLLGFVDLPGGGKMPISTASLNVAEFADYVNRLTAYAATELGVIFEDPAL